MSATIGGLNPLIQLGQLNRVRGSVSFPNFSGLNVTAPYLAPEGIMFTRKGQTTTNLPAMVGIVPSQEPYQMVGLAISLLRTVGLAQVFETQLQNNSYLGPATVRPDAATLSPYNFLAVSIIDIGELRFNGTTPIYGVELEGYYPVNSSMFG